MENKFFRDVFFDKLYEYAKQDRNLMLVVADMSAPALDKFRLELSSQFINTGIAEQNAIQIASGLSITGKKAYAYAISSFITLRALEQIRVSNGIMEIPITIIGMGTGLSYMSDGPTHHLIEDIAIMRAMPNIEIINVSDIILAKKSAEYTYNSTKGTKYIRLDKDMYPIIHDDSTSIEDSLKVIKDGDDVVILSTGIIIHSLMDVVKQIESERNIKIKIVDVFKLTINVENLINSINGAKQIFTIEEGFLPGGFGSSVCEILSDNNICVPTYRIGIHTNNGYKFSYKYGGRNVIRHHVGLDFDGIYNQIINNLK